MQVETFECAETAAEPTEACEEALALIESLGLEGQKQLTAQPDGKPMSRMPYREMTAEERFVYGVLCPEQTDMHKYKASPIPLRVLQIAAHAHELGEFKKLEVWDRKSVVVKDPVLVAYKQNKERWMPDDVFILARWGETLETFHVLLQRALEEKRRQCMQRLESVSSKAKMLLDNIQSLESGELIQHGATWLPTFDS